MTLPFLSTVLISVSCSGGIVIVQRSRLGRLFLVLVDRGIRQRHRLADIRDLDLPDALVAAEHIGDLDRARGGALIAVRPSARPIPVGSMPYSAGSTTPTRSKAATTTATTTLAAMRFPDGACQPGDGSEDTGNSP